MGLSKPTTSTVTHGMLLGRGEADQHPQTAVTGLAQAITDITNISSAKYTKPGTGIPSGDLEVLVQTLLAAAGSAYQKPAPGIPLLDLVAAVQTSLGKADTGYQKPGLGIPLADLVAAVQTSLGKADTSYQKPAPGIPESDFATVVSADVATANTIVKRKADGTIAGSIVGDAATVGGKTPGNAAGNVALNNGVVSATLNADLLDGLHSGAFLPAGSSVNGLDMNNVTATGFYYGSSMTNHATTGLGISMFIVINYSTDWVTQIEILPGATLSGYIRTRYSGTTWSAWSQIASQANLDSHAATASVSAHPFAARMTTGIYTGDGTASRHMIIGFQPNAVWVFSRNGANSGGFLSSQGSWVIGNNGIASTVTGGNVIDIDGFVSGSVPANTDSLNVNTIVYTWIAIGNGMGN